MIFDTNQMCKRKIEPISKRSAQSSAARGFYEGTLRLRDARAAAQGGASLTLRIAIGGSKDQRVLPVLEEELANVRAEVALVGVGGQFLVAESLGLFEQAERPLSQRVPTSSICPGWKPFQISSRGV